ncbi:MAG TPA: TonB-dependent receptor [Anaerohalosphaeraceae bacterium]|nr:TonB-dependent receptor [Anaerohalosphaeraceae bacterium]
MRSAPKKKGAPAAQWIVLLLMSTVVWGDSVSGLESNDLYNLSLEQLLNIDISVVSKKEETLFEAPGVAVIVPQEEWTLFGDRTLFGLMQRQPSIYTRSSFVFSDNLAGFRGNMSTHAEMHTLILINNRPVRESALGYNFPLYMAYPLAALESVEIIRGPGSVLYGTNAFTGVVNLKTRNIPEKPEWTLSGVGGSYGYYQGTFAGGGRFGSLGLFGTFQSLGQQGEPYKMFDSLGVPGRDDRHSRNFSGTLHLSYEDFTADVFAADIDTYSMGVMPFWSNPHHESQTSRLFSNLGWRHPLADSVELELNLTYNQQKDSLSSPAPLKIGTNSEDWLGEITLYAEPTEGLNLVFGYLKERRRNFRADEDHFQSIPPYKYYPQSAYAQADYQLGTWAKFITGTQWNESGQGREDFVFRHGLILTPFERWGVKLLYGEAFRAPVAMESDLYDPPILTGNPNLEPETIATYDAQLFYHTEKTFAALTVFQSTIEKLIIYNTSVSPWSYMNGGKQTFKGLEVEWKHFLSPRWQILGSYLHQENQADAGLNPTVVPENMFKTGTAYEWEKGSVGVFVTHFGKPPQVDSPMNINPNPKAVTLLSVNLQMDISDWMGMKKGCSTLMLKGENLLNDKEFAPTFAYTGTPNSFPYCAGRTFYAGVKITF